MDLRASEARVDRAHARRCSGRPHDVAEPRREDLGDAEARRVLVRDRGRAVRDAPVPGAVAPAELVLAVVEEVPREPEARRPVVAIRRVEAADGAGRRRKDGARGDSRERGRALALVEVQVAARVRVTRDAEQLVAHAEVEGQVGADPPHVGNVERRLVVAGRALEPRERVDRVGPERAAEHEVVERVGHGAAERDDRLAEGARIAVVGDARPPAAELEEVRVDDVAELLGEPEARARPVGREPLARRERKVARERDRRGAVAERDERPRQRVERRSGRALAERTQLGAPVEDELRRRDRLRVDGDLDARLDRVVRDAGAGVEAGVGADGDRSGEERRAVEPVPDHQHRQVGDSPVGADHRLGRVLRGSGARVAAYRDVELCEGGEVRAERGERTRPRERHVADPHRARVDAGPEREVVEEGARRGRRGREKLGRRHQERRVSRAAHS